MSSPTTKVNSLEFFHINWKVWKIIGLRLFKRDVHTQQRLPVSRLYLSWCIAANFAVTILFPIHLSMGIFDDKSKLFDGLNVTVTSIGATVKFFLMASKMKQIAQMEALIQVLDARVTHLEELEHYRTRIRLNILNIQRMYLSLYSGIGVALAASILFSKERRLLYPGWLPFDWRTSIGYYALAMLYQLFGFAIQISQTFSNDSFAPKTLCILSAHIELLYKRVSRIGFDGPYAGDSGSKAALVQQEEELKRCVLDQINLYDKMKQIAQMEALIRVLDARVTHQEELNHYRMRTRLNILNVQKMFLILYCGIGAAVAASFLFSGERRLFFPGWLPFDWRQSIGFYALGILYQLFCIVIQISQNFSNDSFTPKALCLLSAHIELLYMRVSRIGFDDSHTGGSCKTHLQEQDVELKRCVLDQINLYELYKTIQDIISWAMVIQLLVSVLNNCVAMVALLFFATELFDRIYYSIYIVGLAMQLFPSCYYGSDFVLLFEKLHYAVFSCNWIGQSKSFKRHMMIFTERSLRQTMALAGGMFPIHLDTFFATAKATYSLFALIITIK